MNLVTINYQTRDLGYGSEEGTVNAYLTDEIDTWGKRTFQVILPDGDLQPWYLFPDEYEITEHVGHAFTKEPK